jgi:hypothetical protein
MGSNEEIKNPLISGTPDQQMIRMCEGASLSLEIAMRIAINEIEKTTSVIDGFI